MLKQEIFWRKIEGKLTAEKDRALHLEIANKSGIE